MKLVVQRVKKSNLKIKNKLYSSINAGMVILIGISKNDNYEMAKELANKIIKLRIFNDDKGKMNKNIMEIKGEVLVISQIYFIC